VILVLFNVGLSENKSKLFFCQHCYVCLNVYLKLYIEAVYRNVYILRLAIVTDVSNYIQIKDIRW